MLEKKMTCEKKIKTIIFIFGLCIIFKEPLNCPDTVEKYSPWQNDTKLWLPETTYKRNQCGLFALANWISATSADGYSQNAATDEVKKLINQKLNLVLSNTDKENIALAKAFNETISPDRNPSYFIEDRLLEKLIERSVAKGSRKPLLIQDRHLIFLINCVQGYLAKQTLTEKNEGSFSAFWTGLENESFSNFLSNENIAKNLELVELTKNKTLVATWTYLFETDPNGERAKEFFQDLFLKNNAACLVNITAESNGHTQGAHWICLDVEKNRPEGEQIIVRDSDVEATGRNRHETDLVKAMKVFLDNPSTIQATSDTGRIPFSSLPTNNKSEFFDENLWPGRNDVFKKLRNK